MSAAPTIATPRRPRIGICAGVEQARWSVWDSRTVLLPHSYVDAVQRAGGVAILLPPDPDVRENPGSVLELVDGLLLAGGVDIDPLFYGAARHAEVTETVPARDAFEIALARFALERDLPLLGICRGMQVMNVACGGTLIQHLPDDVGHEDHRRSLGSFDNADHDVRLEPGSLVARAAGEIVHGTKSHHHQGVARIGDGLTVTGWATVDELPEAVEDSSRRFALGVQWHPEADPKSKVVQALVDEARANTPSGAATS
jgi:putative glutamine amidotransferase